MKDKINNLYNKDSNSAYQTLKELEIKCTESNELYLYFDEFLDMLKNSSSYVRVRGFRLIAALARWDVEGKINKNIDLILQELEDDKGTSVRQCLECLGIILLYKYELSNKVEEKLKSLDLSKHKESMQSLISKDIKYILEHL